MGSCFRVPEETLFLCLPVVFIFSQILTEYVAIETEGVCVCVCVSVCVSVCVCHLYSPYGLVDFDETFHKWSVGYLPVTFFTDFENSKWMTSWRPFCTFFIPALSRSQFCSDFLQNWAQGTKLSSNVCYWKSAKSVGNFRQYGEPRFRKKSKWPPKIKVLKSGK